MIKAPSIHSFKKSCLFASVCLSLLTQPALCDGGEEKQKTQVLIDKVEEDLQLSAELNVKNVSPNGKIAIVGDIITGSSYGRSSPARRIFETSVYEDPVYITQKGDGRWSSLKKIEIEGGVIEYAMVMADSHVFCSYYPLNGQTFKNPYQQYLCRVNTKTGKAIPMKGVIYEGIVEIRGVSPDQQHLLLSSFFDNELPAEDQRKVQFYSYVVNGEGQIVQKSTNFYPIAWVGSEQYVGYRDVGVQRKLIIVDVKTGEETTIPFSEKGLSSFQPCDVSAQSNGVVKFEASGPGLRYNDYTYDIHTKDLTQITFDEKKTPFNQDKIKIIHWPTDNGEIIEGMLLYPEGYKEGKRYPMVVQIHGGPLSNWNIQQVHNFDQYSQAGYFVLFPNVRGSTGYGLAFAQGIGKNLGVWDATDILYGIDHLDSQGLVDKNRVSLGGHSYGGYLVTQMVSKHDNFRAASVEAGMSDYLYRGIADMDWVPSAWLGPLGENYDLWRERSPIVRAESIRTPIFIVHGTIDPRTAPSSSKTLAYSLLLQEKPVEGFYAKEEGHGLNRDISRKKKEDLLKFHMKWNPPGN